MGLERVGRDGACGVATVRTIDRRPTRLASGTACLFAVVGAGAVALLAWEAVVPSILGLLCIVIAVISGWRLATTLGLAGIGGGAILAGAFGVPVEIVVLAVAMAVLAWDAARTAIDLGSHVGRNGTTRRVELTHILASIGVATIASGGGLLVYGVGRGGQPISALLALIVITVIVAMLLTIDYASIGSGSSTTDGNDYPIRHSTKGHGPR